MKKLFLLAALIFFVCSTSAAILNVPSGYSTIQSAINAASAHDTVLVDAGTYFENINFRSKSIVLTSKFYITGSLGTVANTIINGSTPVYYDSSSCVIITNCDSTTVLQGFTITGGKGTKWNDEHAAGRYREGGGVLVQYSSPYIMFNIIKNNQSITTDTLNGSGGGGMRIGDSRPKVYNNIIMNNFGLYGAGVVLNYSGGTFKNNIICINYGSSDYGGGAAFWLNSNLTGAVKVLENNTITGNMGAAGGIGGIYVGGTSVLLRNNIIWGNDGVLNHNQITGNGVSATYNDVQNGYTGAGNQNFNPLFADSSYMLQPTSPCIDKGDSSTVYNDVSDPGNPSSALYPSKGTIRNDMGAYGGPLAKRLTGEIIGIHQIGNEVPSGFSLKQNYPNPFNPSTIIKFDIPSNNGGKSGQLVKLFVYDMLGREVSTLVNMQLEPGSYSVDLNASNYSTGVYFYKLIAGSFNDTKKMILIK